jgi:hypothetical protein
MEADWEVEIGPGAPIIDASWSGFADLRREPALARQLPEADILPCLADALVRLNSARSSGRMWTAKCDVWHVAKEDAIDPYELNATPAEAASAWACYIDLLPVSDLQWRDIRDPETNTPLAAVEWCKSVCERLHSATQRCCRVDLVIRNAVSNTVTSQELMDIGVTVYLTACGATSNDALMSLSRALERFVDGFEPDAKVE